MQIDTEYITVSVDEVRNYNKNGFLEKQLNEIVCNRREDVLKSVNIDESKKRLLQIKSKLLFFENCTDMELIHVVENVKVLKLEASEKIFLENEPTKEMYFVVSGTIDILKKIKKQEDPQIIGNILSNDVFGEIAYINQEPRTATAQVSEKSPAILISFNIKENISENMEYIYMKIYLNFAQLLAKKLNKANLKLV